MIHATRRRGVRHAVCFLPPALTQAAWQLSEDVKSDWWQANAHRCGSYTNVM
ncbi:MAG: hypothetical protein NTX09_11040 [Verrucomicrobia bacterium]|nr:hypothetical protein [Verrucomicrobiota bacterium]